MVVRRRVQAEWQLPRALVTVVLALLMVAPLLAPRSAHAAPSDVWTFTHYDSGQQVIAFTFDAGSDRGYAPQILDILRDKGVPSTFGMTGVWAQQNPDLIHRIHDEGHMLINHSWNHPSFPSLTSAQRASQLKQTADLIRSQVGVELAPWFRPPYGEYNDATLNDLAANGYTRNVLWTVDSLGWNGLSAPQITQRVVNGATWGGIILFHVGAASQDATALPGMIDQLRAKGYRFVTVEQLVNGDERFFPETGHTVSDNFLRYWNSFGGLPVFGYPISDVFERDGKQMQYFERVRMELHPGVWPARFDVLLGRLGADMTAGREQEAAFRPVAGGSNPNCDYYPQTGHWLCWGFRGYWRTHGALEIFGYPISEEFREVNPDTGQTYTVQYFERTRFEYHPENKAPWDILGGLIGKWAMEQGW